MCLRQIKQKKNNEKKRINKSQSEIFSQKSNSILSKLRQKCTAVFLIQMFAVPSMKTACSEAWGRSEAVAFVTPSACQGSIVPTSRELRKSHYLDH